MLMAQRSLRLGPGGPGWRIILCRGVLCRLGGLHGDGHVAGGELTVFVRHFVFNVIWPRVVRVRRIEHHLRRVLSAGHPAILSVVSSASRTASMPDLGASMTRTVGAAPGEQLLLCAEAW
jgi:hypothetical protein